MSSLAELYAGGMIDAKAVKQAGANAGAYSATQGVRRRKFLLTTAIRSGRLSPDKLGPQDRAVLTGGISGGVSHDAKSASHGILGFLHNVGSDIAGLRYLPAGLYHTGADIVSDAVHNRGFKDSHLIKNEINPIIKNYKDVYGPGGGSFLHNLYAHPLGPILDVAAIGSGGASLAAKAGSKVAEGAAEGSRLAELGQKAAAITSPGGRAPLNVSVATETTPDGRLVYQLPREYTERPLAKLGQKALDKVASRGDEVDNPIYRMQVGMERRRTGRVERANTQQQALQASGQEVSKLQAIAKLDPDEATALFLQHQGINTPQLIDLYQASARKSLEDPLTRDELHNTGMDLGYIEHQAALPDRVKQLITNPSTEEFGKLQEADKVWSDYVERNRDQVVTPEVHEAHLTQTQQRLLEHLSPDEREKTIAQANDEAQIKPNYAPVERAEGFKQFNPRLAAVVPSRFHDTFGVGEFKKAPRGISEAVREVDDRQIFGDPRQSYLMHSTGETLLSGTARTDARVYLDHVRTREKDMVEAGLNREWAHQRAVKNGEGAEMTFENTEDMYKQLGGKEAGNYKLVHPDMPIAFVRAQHSLIEDVLAAVEKVRKDHPNDPELNNFDMDGYLKNLADKDAQAFIQSHWAAFKKPGIAIPTKDYNYLVDLTKTPMPFNNPVARLLSRLKSYWAAATLSYMPRWAVNTAMGSFITNMVEGVWNPLDYLAGHKMRNNLPPGVRLGHTFEQEMLDMAAPGMGKRSTGMLGEVNQFMLSLGIKLGRSDFANKVQNIENFFRQAAYIKQMRKQGAKLGKNDIALDMGDGVAEDLLSHPDQLEAVNEIMDTAGGFMTHTLMSDKFKGNIAKALEDPDAQRRALTLVNKFGYNYSVLGPVERRMVRQFIPFWGWYKFISMATYRLPVEYPGRSAAILALSKVAEDDEAKLGAMPDWVKGGIPLPGSKGSKYNFLGTLGMNPFGQVFNPMAPGKSLLGALSFGQMSPEIQAAAAALGYDPLTGGSVRISPQEGVTTNRFGDLVNSKGEPVSAAQVAPIRRGLMALLRSVPQVRLAEHALYGSVYPESVPGIDVHKMPTNSSTGSALGELVQGFVGVNPRTFDLSPYQRKVRTDSQLAKAKLRKLNR